MKTFKKWLLIAIITIAVVVTALVSYITLALPNVGKPEKLLLITHLNVFPMVSTWLTI